MAVTDDISSTIGGMFGNVFKVSTVVLVGILIFFLILGMVYYFFIYRRKFDIKVKILSERANDQRVVFDTAAILTDRKTKKKYFKLLSLGYELPVPPFNVLQSTNKGDYLELWRKSQDEFCFITSPNIDRQTVIRSDGKIYPVAQTKQRHFEADLEWTARRREETKDLLNPNSLLMTLLQYAPQIVSTVFLLIILWMFMDRLPPLISQLTELAKTLNTQYGASGSLG